MNGFALFQQNMAFLVAKAYIRIPPGVITITVPWPSRAGSEVTISLFRVSVLAMAFLSFSIAVGAHESTTLAKHCQYKMPGFWVGGAKDKNKKN